MVYHLTHEDVRTATKVVTSMIKLNLHLVYALFDLGATFFFFVASRNMNKLNFDRGILEREIVVSIHLGESIDIEDVCKRCVLSIEGKRMRLNLIPLKIFDFDITLGMDWLSVHRA
jgi:hypothetical protein